MGHRALAAALLTATSQGLTYWSAAPQVLLGGLGLVRDRVGRSNPLANCRLGKAPSVRHRLAFGWLVGVTSGLFYIVPQVALGWLSSVRAATGSMVEHPGCGGHGRGLFYGCGK